MSRVPGYIVLEYHPADTLEYIYSGKTNLAIVMSSLSIISFVDVFLGWFEREFFFSLAYAHTCHIPNW